MGSILNIELMKELFHKLANEGKAIHEMRMQYLDSGIVISAHRAEMFITLNKIKKLFNNK